MIRRILTLMVVFYKRYVSRMMPPACRFYPTCSDYALEALQRKSLHVGVWLIFRRLMKCHPFHSGGFDPVP